MMCLFDKLKALDKSFLLREFRTRWNIHEAYVSRVQAEAQQAGRSYFQIGNKIFLFAKSDSDIPWAYHDYVYFLMYDGDAS